jgi:hypothetical protein
LIDLSGREVFQKGTVSVSDSRAGFFGAQRGKRDSAAGARDTAQPHANKPGCQLPAWSARLAIQDTEEDAAPAPHNFPLVCFRPSFVLLVE